MEQSGSGTSPPGGSKESWRIAAPATPPYSLSMSKDGKTLSIGFEGGIRLLNFANGEDRLISAVGIAPGMGRTALSPDGKILATASHPAITDAITLIDTTTRTKLRTLEKLPANTQIRSL